MPAITALSFSAAAPIQRVLTGIWRQFAYRAKRLEPAIERRRAAQALARFDDRMLADIGLTRGDLNDALAEPLWRDPTSVLARRHCERRKARRAAATALIKRPSPPLVPGADGFAFPPRDPPARLTL